MSMFVDVYLARSRLPGFAEWENAIAENGFALTFPDPVDLTKHTGFLPALFGDEETAALLGGQETGFEFYLSPLAESDEVPDEARVLSPAADTVATFTFHETHDCIAAAIASAVMARLTNGLCLDSESGECFQGNEAVAVAKDELAAAIKAARAARSTKLSPIKWARAFEETMQRIHSDYALSEQFRGRLVECVREHETGLFISQNCVRMHDSYRHCFCVLLTGRKLSGVLSSSPFELGSRFDHNYTISHAYNRDYRAGAKWRVAAKEWHSNYRLTARGTWQWVERTANSAERFLLPTYVNRLYQGAGRVLQLLRDAAAFLERWGVSDEALNEPVREAEFTTALAAEFGLATDPNDWDEHFVQYHNALGLAAAGGCPALLIVNHRRAAINMRCDDIALASKNFLSIPDHIRSAAIIVGYIEDFLAVREELPSMIQIVQELKALPTPNSDERQDSRRQWWRFW